MGERVKAIGLFSGGLDSMLAVKLLQAQDIEVIGYAFVTPFFGPELALKSSKVVGIQLELWEITDRYMEVMKSPKYGFGKNMNPCIDCHALMFRLAGQKMAAHEARFLFSGEVLGERPFSQNKGALRAVARLSGYQDAIVRPLSARLLEETPPEKAGWVDRARLEDIQGRARKRQMELAAHFGISDYPKPAGGCLLTEPNFSKRLKDLLGDNPDPRHRDLELLKVGRHIRWGGRVQGDRRKKGGGEHEVGRALGEGGSPFVGEGVSRTRGLAACPTPSPCRCPSVRRSSCRAIQRCATRSCGRGCLHGRRHRRDASNRCMSG